MQSSGTGVYYQAIPAVRPDGKNVMTLIPVKKVNGQFVPMQVLPTKIDHQPTHTSPASLPHNSFRTLQPLPDGGFILQTPVDTSNLFTPVKSQHQGTNTLILNAANQVHASVVTHRMAQNVVQSPLQNKTITVTNNPQIANTVKSPVLPSGHYLQIPANATVKTLPVSALPPSVKNRICNSANASANPVKGLPMVLYVSPVNSLKLNEQMASVSNQTEFPQAIGPAPTVSSVDASTPKPSQVASTPVKWVVQERAGSSAPYLIPVTSPSMSSDILKAVKQMESERSHHIAKGELASTDSDQEKIAPGKDNALVMCNGKVYFVTKKNSVVTKDVLTNAESRQMVTNAKKSLQPSATTSNVSQKQDTNSEANKKTSDVIDLCGEDEENSACKRSVQITVPIETQNENEEDSNVIFVSYIPPKPSETESGTETAVQSSEKEVDKSEINTKNMEKGSELNIGSITDLDVSKCETKEPALEKREPHLEQPEVCSPGNDVPEKTVEKTNLDQLHRPKSDSEIRKNFGIVSDLRVSLQSINVSKESHSQEEKQIINKRTLEGIRKLIMESRVESKIKRLMQDQVPSPKQEEEIGPKYGKKQRLEHDEETSSLDTSALSQCVDAAECDSDVQRVSTEDYTDNNMLQTCEGAEEECPSTSEACEISKQTTSSSILEPAQTCTAISHNTPTCCSGLRKTPPRQTKGSGKMCTACPCGTKVGGVPPNSESKPNKKPDLSAGVDLFISVSSELSRGPTADVVSKRYVTHSRKDVKCSLQTVPSPTSQPQGDGPLTTKEICHSSENLPQVKSSETRSSSRKETVTHKQKEVDVKVVSPPGRYCASYQIPSELYSSVVLDPEEIKRQERINRLKDVLREKEAALEKLRKNM